MRSRPDLEYLKQLAKDIRRDILIMLERAGSGHTGGSLSMVEILITLYFYKLRHNPKEPNWNQRDIFILSKGHGCPALYATLSYAGYFPKNELLTLRKLGTRLQGHPQMGLPGVEISSGSLGQGLSIVNGFALSAKLDKNPRKIFCLMGDGELDEGQVWEAAMTASHYNLDNVCGIVDYNKFQIDGPIKDIKNLEPLSEKWSSFGWNALEADGHDFALLMDAFDRVDSLKGKPTVILAHTTKGKGVSFMENENAWHGVAPKKEDLEKALKELEKN